MRPVPPGWWRPWLVSAAEAEERRAAVERLWDEVAAERLAATERLLADPAEAAGEREGQSWAELTAVVDGLRGDWG